MEFTIGCDPELFAIDKDGSIRSAYGLIPGNKEEPYKVNNGAVQVDGMALEFNTDPVKDRASFTNNVMSVKQQLQDMVYTKGYGLAVETLVKFDEEYFSKQHPLAKELGCDPDLNAWSIVQLEEAGLTINDLDSEDPVRVAGGHIHIGWTQDADIRCASHIGDCSVVAKQLDYFLGLPSLLWDNSIDRDSYYGAAGSFRSKPYGIEYRALSNQWIKCTDTIELVYDLVDHAMDRLNAGFRAEDQFGSVVLDIRYGPGKEYRHKDSICADYLSVLITDSSLLERVRALNV